MREIFKALTGNGGDVIGALAEKLAAERKTAADAYTEIERLEQARRTAGSFEAARAIDEEIARARWAIERADAVIPELERRLALVRTEHQAAAIVRHHRAAEKVYRKLRVAIEAAAAAQVEAIAVRDAAIAELGEGIAQGKVPIVAFNGFLLPDLVAVWGTEMDRAFAGPPPPKPISARVNQTIPAITAGAREPKPAAQPKPSPPMKREPRRDTAAGEGQRLVMMLRSGVDVGGFQARHGDVMAVSTEIAERLVMNGAADFVTAAPSPSPETILE